MVANTSKSARLRWSPELANAVANHERMPGVERYRTQYVRYRGQPKAQATNNGWIFEESVEGLKRLVAREGGGSGAPAANPASDAAAPDAAARPKADPAAELQRILSNKVQHPAQVQLHVNIAPAEFCLPMKNDRQFKPHFQVQVDVSHKGELNLPLRLKAYVISQEEHNNIVDWMPEELDTDGGGAPPRRQLTELKGNIVVSHVFKSADVPAKRQKDDRIRSATASGRGGNRQLLDSDSIRSTENDVDMATTLDVESSKAASSEMASGMNTILAQYEFKNLEFAKPTRMNKVYMLFACLVMDVDLLYTVYEVPCISICRAEQRHKALQKLGMPVTAFDDCRGNHGIQQSEQLNLTTLQAPAAAERPPPRSLEATYLGLNQGAGLRGARAPQDRPQPPSYEARGRSAAANHAPNGSAAVGVSAPDMLTPEDVELARSLEAGISHGNLPPLDHLPPGGDSMMGDLQDALHYLMASDSMGPRDPCEPRLLDCLRDDAQADDFQMRHNYWADLMSESALAGAGAPPAPPTGGGHQGAFGLGAAGQQAIPGYAGAGAGGAAGRFGLLGDEDGGASVPARPHVDHTATSTDNSGAGGYSDAGPSRMFQHSAPPGVPPLLEVKRQQTGGDDDSPHRVFRQRMAPPAQPDGAAPALAQHGGFGAFEDQQLDLSRLLLSQGGDYRERAMADGVNQKQAYDWIIDEYNKTGLQRRLLGQDLKALLSAAGFPPMAGLNLNFRVARHQFLDFQHTFSMVLAMLRRIAGLWNMQDPCIVSGFDMDRATAIAALAAEPPGTFICRFSMNQIGCLVLSCKVSLPPGAPPTPDGDLFHATINIDDLQDRSVDQLILGLPHASHVLDVYTNRRVDKRHILAAGYMRVRNLQHQGRLGEEMELSNLDV